MESPQAVHESKAFRWVGHLSEEELLGGPPAALSRRKTVSFEPRSMPVSPRLHAPSPPVADPLAVPPRWRLQGRDLIALAAVAAAVWFALRGAEGLPFRSSEAAQPVAATKLVTTDVALDREQLRSLPRGVGVLAGNSVGVKGNRDDRGGSGSGHNPKPPDDTSTSPLLEVAVPGVGTVTVNDPEAPDATQTPGLPLPDAPSLPGTGDVLPQTPAVSLP